jgi:hypothetical protein
MEAVIEAATYREDKLVGLVLGLHKHIRGLATNDTDVRTAYHLLVQF